MSKENARGMQDDVISRREAIDALYSVDEYNSRSVKAIKQLPPIQPADNLQKLADEIASFKRHVKSDNSDYLTGFCAHCQWSRE